MSIFKNCWRLIESPKKSRNYQKYNLTNEENFDMLFLNFMRLQNIEITSLMVSMSRIRPLERLDKN